MNLSALWMVPTSPHPPTANLLIPLHAIYKGQSLYLNTAQFTLIFWIQFPFMRKSHPRPQ